MEHMQLKQVESTFRQQKQIHVLSLSAARFEAAAVQSHAPQGSCPARSNGKVQNMPFMVMDTGPSGIY